MRQAKKTSALAKKRAERARKGLTAPARSDPRSTSGTPKSTAIALYNGAAPRGHITTTTLSKKRLQKIERNKKYISKRNEMLLVDATAQLEEKMDIDNDNEDVSAGKKSKLSSVKDALWSVIADQTASPFVVDQSGEGTTLGSQSF